LPSKEKPLKFRTLNLALTLALATAGIAQAADKPQPRTLVKVNGEAVKETHFMIYSAQRGQGQQLDQQAQLGLLNELVNTVMIAQQAEKKGLDKHPELLAAMDVARYRILAEAAVQQHLRDNPVTDKQISDAYQAKYGNKNLTEYKARHILLKTEDEAKTVIAQLDQGSDFAKLAKEKSTGPSGANGGDLGWFEKGTMVKPFGDAVAKMRKGSHSAAPVQTQFGWHVIELEDSRDREPPKLEAVKAGLTQQLNRDKVAAYLKAIRDKSKVQVLEPEQTAKIK
jgi:peptidyl-prolyl cis-trans isomerase C